MRGRTRITTKQFSDEVRNLTGEEYSVLGEFTKSNIKVKIKHNKCGHEYSVTRIKFLTGRRCPNCKKNKKLTFDDVMHIAKEHNLKMLFDESSYTTANNRYLFETEDGYRIQISVIGLRDSKKISPFNVHNEFSLDNVRLYCAKNGGHKCLSDKFEGWKKKLLFKCENDIHEPYEMKFGDFFNGKRCRYCAYEDISKRMTGFSNPMFGVIGDKHPNYNEELTQEDREAQRETDDYKKFKKEVRIKNQYKCKCCKSRGMIIHHLNGYHWFKEGRLLESNVVTLCKTCHDSFHAEYGRKWNTKEQFEQFLKNF